MGGVPRNANRMRDLIEVGLLHQPRHERSRCAWWAHATQGVQRPKVFAKTFPVLSQQSSIFDYFRQRMLVGVEHMAVHGWPCELDYRPVDTESRLREVSGEGMVLEFKGTGTIWLQTRNVPSLVDWVTPFLPG